MNEEITKLLKPLAKTSTKLNLKKVDNFEDLPLIGTHFGGQPYAEAGDEYPVCPTCSNSLTFIYQIDTRQGFHEKPKHIEFFTFFYCVKCFPWGFENDPKGQWIVRTYNQPDEIKFVKIQPYTKTLYEVQPCIVNAEKITIFPDYEELDNLSIEISNAVKEINIEDFWDEYDEAVEELGGFTSSASTIGGYPFWVQNADVFNCDICENRMKLLAQIDSEEEANLNWGDSGLIYLFFCENHPAEIKFTLQCY